MLKYYPYLFQKTGFDISCKLSPLETICMKCQILFSGKNKKKFVVCWINPESDKGWNSLESEFLLHLGCKLSPLETICMKCQILFSGKNKKKCHQFIVCWINPESDKGWNSLESEFFYTLVANPLETICMKCQILFSGKNKKKCHQFVVCWINPESDKGWNSLESEFLLHLGCV